MPPESNRTSSSGSVLLLKGAAATFVVIGGGTVAWGLDKWIRYPETRASQFGFEAPLWPAFTLFVLLATLVGVRLLWAAAERVEGGEDLFAQRHRRPPSSSDPPGENRSSDR